MGRLATVAPEPTLQELPCWECRRPLSILPDCSPLLFRCSENHYSTAKSILSKWLPDGVHHSTRTLRLWEDRARSILLLARSALLGRSFFDVEALMTAAGQIEDRVEELRSRHSRSSILSSDRSA